MLRAQLLALLVLSFSPSSFARSSTGPSLSFRFAYADPLAGGAAFLQGAPDSVPGFEQACGASGLQCNCDFLDSGGNVLDSTAVVYFDPAAAYFECHPSSNLAAAATLRLSASGAAVSAPAAFVTSFDYRELLGGLDANGTNYIYRYSCAENFLQMTGTTQYSFSCAPPANAASCDTNSNFCLLQAEFNFYLFANASTSNFSEKASDLLYNGSTGLCGLQISEISCTRAPAALQLGLYAEAAGPWQVPVSLPSAPGLAPIRVGYAARPSPVTGHCPPGLELQNLFTAKIVASSATANSNFPPDATDTIVESVQASPGGLTVAKYGQGNCSIEGRCSMPASYSGVVLQEPYQSTSAYPFCVLPAAALP